MCIEKELSDKYKEIIENFKETFEVVHQLFGLSQTLKIHIIFDHYSDYFEMFGTNFKDTNGEHHEALHHTLKDMERNRGLYMNKKTWARAAPCPWPRAAPRPPAATTSASPSTPASTSATLRTSGRD